jgi:ATP-dependent Clp protease ATP-binding subunit ClpA
MGFTQQDHSSDGMESIKKLFTPDFRNRLDSVVQFKPLDRRILSSVVDKFVIQLEAQLEDKRVSLHVDEQARAWLAEKGYDEKMGARPMARTIQDYIKKPLANELLFGELAKGGHVKVTVKDGELVFDTAKAKSKETA